MHALVWSGTEPRRGSDACGSKVHRRRLEERAYLHFVWRKYLGVYFTSDDGHHLQFHIYRWHSPSRSETVGLIKSLCRVKILCRNATLGPVQFCLYQRRELLTDSSLRRQECCRSLSLSLSLSWSPTLSPPPSPCGSRLTSFLSSRSCFTPLQRQMKRALQNSADSSSLRFLWFISGVTLQLQTSAAPLCFL